MTAPIELPPLVRMRVAANGPAAAQWLARLPEVVERLAGEWGLTLGAVKTGGTASLVMEATASDGRLCVLKLAMPLTLDEGEFERSVLVHRLAAGEGMVELLAHDATERAMVLERLGPNVHELELPLPAVLEAVVSALAAFWRPVPADVALPDGAEKAAWLAAQIPRTWEELGRPCPAALIDAAVAACAERADSFDRAAAVLVHGDAHGWNTLAAGDGRFKLVDPEGLVSERAHELSVLMREYNAPLLAGDTRRLVRERAEWLGEACDADADAIWQWRFIERVSTGLLSMRELDSAEGAMFLEVAARCL